MSKLERLLDMVNKTQKISFILQTKIGFCLFQNVNIFCLSHNQQMRSSGEEFSFLGTINIL